MDCPSSKPCRPEGADPGCKEVCEECGERNQTLLTHSPGLLPMVLLVGNFRNLQPDVYVALERSVLLDEVTFRPCSKTAKVFSRRLPGKEQAWSVR